MSRSILETETTGTSSEPAWTVSGRIFLTWVYFHLFVPDDVLYTSSDIQMKCKDVPFLERCYLIEDNYRSSLNSLFLQAKYLNNAPFFFFFFFYFSEFSSFPLLSSGHCLGFGKQWAELNMGLHYLLTDTELKSPTLWIHPGTRWAPESSFLMVLPYSETRGGRKT